MNTIIAVTAMLLVIGLGAWLSFKAGGKVERSETADDELEAIDEANAARERLDSDPEYADSVRDRFTR